MPILRRETDVFPENLFDLARGIGERQRQWWVLYTRSRREKDLMRRLLSKEIPFYGPIVGQRRKLNDGRIRTSYLPLFPGYVFLYGDETERYEALVTGCISRHLPVPDEARLVTDLQQFHRLLAEQVPLVPEERLLAGCRVRVRSGGLAGIEGTIVRREGRARLLVAIDFLQRGASLLLDDLDVERV